MGTFRHMDYDGKGFELCSGREGWANRMTTDRALVTCKNCLKALARADKAGEPIDDFKAVEPQSTYRGWIDGRP